MDDIVNLVPSWTFMAIVTVCVLFIIGIIFARFIVGHPPNRHLCVPG